MEDRSSLPDEKVRRLVDDLCGGGPGLHVLKALAAIRREVLVRADGARQIRESGGLEPLVMLLRKRKERLRDSALSALATCCLEDESSLAVGKMSVSMPLVSLVKTSSCDSTVGRACRLMGNLARKPCNAESLHAAGAVSALLAALERRDDKMSYPTLAMLVRAVRLLWMIPERREEMMMAGSVRAIAILLTAECESSGLIKTLTMTNRQADGIRKSQEELFVGLLKCLGYFTTLASIQCAEQLQGDGRGYQCLVALTQTHESMALKCLMNLCYVSSCRPLLGVAGVVECIVTVLQKHSDAACWPEGAARALAQLSEESVNRSRLRHYGGLRLLVTAARVSDHALRALLQYIFDDTAFQILINEGLISLLTEEMASYVSTMKCEHNYTEDTYTSAENDANTSSSSDNLQKDDPLLRAHSSAMHQCRNNISSVDELKVVIERDNMIVGFVDRQENFMEGSDADEKKEENRDCEACKRRPASEPNKSKSQLIRMASRDWSSSIYWEPKSPETPSSSRMPMWASDRPDNSPWFQSDRSGHSPEYRSFASQSKRSKCEWSPDSGVGSGGGDWTPAVGEWAWGSGSEDSPGSPLSERTSDSELSGLYSPICSESESDTEEERGEEQVEEADEEPELNPAQVLQELDVMIEDEDTNDPVKLDDKTESASKCGRIGCVQVLLLRVSQNVINAQRSPDDQPPSTVVLDQLTKRECLTALLDYLDKCKGPFGRVARILVRILTNSQSVTTVLRNQVAMRLHNMSLNPRHPTDKCRQCKQITSLCTKLVTQLTALVGCDHGIGEISYQLLKGQAAMQQTLSLTLPYFIRTERPLRKFFLDCGALNILFASLEEDREKIEKCVPALAKLALNLKIKNPKVLEQRFKDHTRVSYDPILDNLQTEDIVTFQLDDSSIVEANKVFLCQNSEVFQAMLMGQFKESEEKCVRLKKVTKGGLQYLLTLLQCGLNAEKYDIETFPLSEQLETSLEVLLLSDRFLLDKLRDHLRSAILQFQLSPDTVERIYVWSLSEGMGVLCVEAVAYLLTGDMSDAERTASFVNICELKYKQQWLEDIKAIMMRQLTRERCQKNF